MSYKFQGKIAIPFVLQMNVGRGLISVDLRQMQNQSLHNKTYIFEGALPLHIRAYFHAFQANGLIGHTCLGTPKLRWRRGPRSLNPSLIKPMHCLKIWLNCDRVKSLSRTFYARTVTTNRGVAGSLVTFANMKRSRKLQRT